MHTADPDHDEPPMSRLNPPESSAITPINILFNSVPLYYTAVRVAVRFFLFHLLA